MSEIILRKDKEWSLIDGELCLITDFTPLSGSTVKNGIAISPDTSKPYASVSIECKKVSKKITGFITHKLDFANIWAAFTEREREINEKKEEVLIYWTTKRYKYNLLKVISKFLLAIIGATPFPKVIVMICPKGTYKSCNDFKLLPDKETRVFVYGLMPIKYQIPDIIK